MLTPTHLGDVLNAHTDREIVERLLELYPDQKASRGGYMVALRKWREKEPVHCTCKLVIEMHTDMDGEPYPSVSGVAGGKTWGMGFMPWSEWAGMVITVKTLRAFPLLDILALSLWEMTFYGYEDNKIKERLAGFNDDIEKFMADS